MCGQCLVREALSASLSNTKIMSMLISRDRKLSLYFGEREPGRGISDFQARLLKLQGGSEGLRYRPGAAPRNASYIRG
jgi:hypothetical protein